MFEINKIAIPLYSWKNVFYEEQFMKALMIILEGIKERKKFSDLYRTTNIYVY